MKRKRIVSFTEKIERDVREEKVKRKEDVREDKVKIENIFMHNLVKRGYIVHLGSIRNVGEIRYVGDVGDF